MLERENVSVPAEELSRSTFASKSFRDSHAPNLRTILLGLANVAALSCVSGSEVKEPYGVVRRLDQFLSPVESFQIIIREYGHYWVYSLDPEFLRSVPELFDTVDSFAAARAAAPFPERNFVDEIADSDFVPFTAGTGSLVSIDDQVIFLSCAHVMNKAPKEMEVGVFMLPEDDFAACAPSRVGLDPTLYANFARNLSMIDDCDLVGRFVKIVGIGRGRLEIIAKVTERGSVPIDGVPGIRSPRLGCLIEGGGELLDKEAPASLLPLSLAGISGAPVIDLLTNELVGLFTNVMVYKEGADSQQASSVISIWFIGPELLRSAITEYIQSEPK